MQDRERTSADYRTVLLSMFSVHFVNSTANLCKLMIVIGTHDWRTYSQLGNYLTSHTSILFSQDILYTAEMKLSKFVKLYTKDEKQTIVTVKTNKLRGSITYREGGNE